MLKFPHIFPHILLLPIFLTIFLTFTFLTFSLHFSSHLPCEESGQFPALMWGNFCEEKVWKMWGNSVENVRKFPHFFLTFSSHWIFIVLHQTFTMNRLLSRINRGLGYSDKMTAKQPIQTRPPWALAFVRNFLKISTLAPLDHSRFQRDIDRRHKRLSPSPPPPLSVSLWLFLSLYCSRKSLTQNLPGSSTPGILNYCYSVCGVGWSAATPILPCARINVFDLDCREKKFSFKRKGSFRLTLDHWRMFYLDKRISECSHH